jgi:flagellar biosynthetic protein FlhB
MGDEDKKHDPTPHKLDEERKKGNVLKVQDAMAAALILASAWALNAVAGWADRTVRTYLVETLQTLPESKHLDLARALIALARAMYVVGIITVPFMLIVAVTALVVLYAQVGWLITFKPLEPKFEKIDPIKGFKNKINPFKMKQAFNLAKTFFVVIVILLFIYQVITGNASVIMQAYTLSPAGALGLVGSLIYQLAKKIVLFMIVLAFVSYLFERWQWWKGLKMSDKEIKDEYKKLEGDPHIKAKQKQKMYEMAAGAAHEAMLKADVLITNPIHYAVALEYKPKRGQKTPVVVAKGKNRMALFLRQLADEQFVPVIEDPPTARALYEQVKIDQAIPRDLFQAVAKIIAMLMKRRQPAQAAAGDPSLDLGALLAAQPPSFEVVEPPGAAAPPPAGQVPVDPASGRGGETPASPVPPTAEGPGAGEA